MKRARYIDLKVHRNFRGSLVAIEQERDIPFEVKRVYYIFDVPAGMKRGFHAHRKLRQLVVCLSGSCRFVVDNGIERQDFVLDAPDRGLYIEGMVWREIHDISEGCVIMVLASELYNDTEYIFDYEHFLKLVREEA